MFILAGWGLEHKYGSVDTEYMKKKEEKKEGKKLKTTQTNYVFL